jgi:beta-lactamase superfamily II metal-dependent hydrolase
VERLQAPQLRSLLRIVTALDHAMNNTSVILLIQAGDRRLLFCGDAQIENWECRMRALG